MTRVLLTGMSGTGKSSLVEELKRRGYRAIDTDYDDWHEWQEVDGELDWLWREDRMLDLLAMPDDDLLFVSGTSANQGRFYKDFDHIVLLTAPTPVILERLASRTNNPFGKSPEELARVLKDIESTEPLLRRGATLEVDTTVSLEQVVETILRHVGP